MAQRDPGFPGEFGDGFESTATYKDPQSKQSSAKVAESPAGAPAGGMPLLDLAKWILMSRQVLDHHIGRELFADPALNILLDLYVNAQEGRSVPTSSACMA